MSRLQWFRGGDGLFSEPFLLEAAKQKSLRINPAKIIFKELHRADVSRAWSQFVSVLCMLPSCGQSLQNLAQMNGTQLEALVQVRKVLRDEEKKFEPGRDGFIQSIRRIRARLAVVGASLSLQYEGALDRGLKAVDRVQKRFMESDWLDDVLDDDDVYHSRLFGDL